VELDIQHRERVIGKGGAYTGWDGAVTPEEYDMMAQKMEQVKVGFLNREAKTLEEREQWVKA
jgi:hypothetical protein